MRPGQISRAPDAISATFMRPPVRSPEPPAAPPSHRADYTYYVLLVAYTILVISALVTRYSFLPQPAWGCHKSNRGGGKMQSGASVTDLRSNPLNVQLFLPTFAIEECLAEIRECLE